MIMQVLPIRATIKVVGNLHHRTYIKFMLMKQLRELGVMLVLGVIRDNKENFLAERVKWDLTA